MLILKRILNLMLFSAAWRRQLPDEAPRMVYNPSHDH